MDSNKALILDGVSVRYRKSDSRSAASIIKRLFKREERSNTFWALKRISFELEKGDMLGVIGKNGAGKSTLMKTISGTLAPAAGEIHKNGTLCALLELSAGFDKEMTVKENVYLRGALLGYSKEFIDSKYDEIIDFADMRDFEDNPFRTLSSGMKSRIAFAIASLVEPDIIILDEVFAVGDGDFKKKSREHMQNILSDGKTTGLMVSHSLGSVRRQCNKVLWLDKGRMVMFGDPNTVCDAYEKYLEDGVLPQTESIKAAKKMPPIKPKHNKGKIIAEIMLFVSLLSVAAVGGFIWAQYDLFKAYNISHSHSAEEILGYADNCHTFIYDALGTDPAKWDYSIFKDSTQAVLDGDLSYYEVAKKVVQKAGIDPDSENYRLSIAAAEIEAIKHVQMARLDGLVLEMREGFESEPEGTYRSLLVYSYTNYDRFYDLEAECDAEVTEVIEEIREILREQGQSEALADQVWSYYISEKVYLEAYYCIQLR